MSEWIIKWEGGDCPVTVDTLVDVKLRNGDIYYNQLAWGKNDTLHTKDDGSSWAGHAFWRNDSSLYDIIAYRIHKEES